MGTRTNQPTQQPSCLLTKIECAKNSGHYPFARLRAPHETDGMHSPFATCGVGKLRSPPDPHLLRCCRAKDEVSSESKYETRSKTSPPAGRSGPAGDHRC